MTKRFLMICLLATAAFGVLAQESARFVSARPSPLKQSGVIKPDETYFSGQVRVSGTFEVFWEPPADGYPGYFRVELHPDASSREILPHDSQRGAVREIWLRNTDVAIHAFLTPGQRNALKSSRAKHATGQVTVLLRSYRTGVDCDQRGYNALLVSTVQQPSHVLADVPVVERADGC